MFFPEQLYQLSGRDQQVTWLDPVYSQLSNFTGAVQVAAPAFQVPLGRAFLLQSFVIDATPGAGQLVTGTFLEIIDAALTTLFIIAQNRDALAVNLFRTLQDSGVGLIFPSGTLLRARATFNLGVAGNAVLQNLGGILIPVGNLQRIS